MTTSQKALAAFFNFTGTMHFVIPKQYEATVPDYIPISAHDAVVYSGYAEIAGALAVIPNNPSRAQRYPVDEHLYAMRSLIECCFSKLKQFRRVSTRYEKTARNYLSVVTLAATILWLR